MKFKSWECRVKWAEYERGGRALKLVSPNGESILTASVYVGELGRGEIAIKDYSENEGVLDWLVKEEIVSPPTRWIHSGFVQIPICEIREEK